MTDAPAPPFNWKVPAGRALEAALNRALALDPDTRAALRVLDGRRVALQLEAPPMALQVQVSGERLEVGPVQDASPADLSVRTSLGGVLAMLPRLLGAATDETAPPVGRLHMSGDAELARRLQRLAERFDPDWALPFTRVFGDVVGVQVANALAATLRQARVTGQALAESAAEYVTEESRDVVARAELSAFHDDVDTLQDDVERLAARVARLRAAAADGTHDPAGAGDGRDQAGPAHGDGDHSGGQR